MSGQWAHETKLKMRTNEGPSTEQLLFLIRRIIAELALEPAKTSVTTEELGFNTVGIDVDPHLPDYGKIIGQNIDHLKAFRMICKLVSDRTGKNFQFTVKRAPENAAQAVAIKHEPVVPQDKWNRDHIQALVEDLFNCILGQPFKVMITDGRQGKTAVDVVIPNSVPRATADFIHRRLEPLMKAVGMKNQRLFSFNVIQDDTALDRLMRNGSGAMAR